MAGINLIWLSFLIRKKVDLDFGRIKIPLLKIIGATLIMTAVAFGSNILLHHILGESNIFLALNLLVSGTLSVITYFVMTLVLKLDIAEQLLHKVKAKLIKTDKNQPVENN